MPAGPLIGGTFISAAPFRILPPAFLVLSVLALLGPVLHVLPVGVKALIACVFFYRNYIAVVSGWYTAHFWSLAVEEQFYLLWPAVLCLVGVARGWRAVVILAGIFALWRHTDKHFGWWSLPLLALTVALVRYPTRWSDDGLDLFMAILPILTVADPRGIVSRVLETRILRWIGDLSYSLYLWQQLFIPLYDEPKSIIQQLPFNVIAAFSAALLSYHLVERPLIRFGRRLVQARALARSSAPDSGSYLLPTQSP